MKSIYSTIPKLSFMYDRIVGYISANSNTTLSDKQIRAILLDYEVIFGAEGIQALYGFIRWAYYNDKEAKDVKSTLFHDLNGRKDRLFSPKTLDGGFIQYINL